MSKNKKFDIDNDLAYSLLFEFHRTHVCSDELANILLKLIDNKLSNIKYSLFNEECKQAMKDAAIMEFLKYGHNFNPKQPHSKGIAIGYMDFCMNNSFNHAITKYMKEAKRDVGIDITDPINATIYHLETDIDGNITCFID